MGSSIMYKLTNVRGENEQWIDGERYLTSAVVRDTPPCMVEQPTPVEVPEDGKEYLVFMAKYSYYARGAEKTQVTVLFRRERVAERQGFDFSPVSEMFADVPWRLPEVLLPPIGPWLPQCERDARAVQFPNARVLYIELCISGPYRAGGDDYFEKEIEEHNYHSYMKAQLKRLNVVRQSHTCAICLAKFVDCPEDVVRTHCSHHFHRHCLETWLLSRNSCPSCRRVVIQ